MELFDLKSLSTTMQFLSVIPSSTMISRSDRVMTGIVKKRTDEVLKHVREVIDHKTIMNLINQI